MSDENKCAQLYKEVEYNEDALNEMLKMQNDLQNMYGEKRGTITPDGKDFSIVEKIDASLYFFNCTVTEYTELIERLTEVNIEDIKISDEPNEQLLELQYEAIDMWHFIMNQLLYLNVKSVDETLSDLFNEGEIDSIEVHFSEVSYIWGKIVNDVPFKKWKSYDSYNFKVDMTDVKDMLISFFSMCSCIGIDEEIFYNLYVTKNQENYDRQQEGGVYSQ